MSAELLLDESPNRRLYAGEIVHAHEMHDLASVRRRADSLLAASSRPEFSNVLYLEPKLNARTSLFEELTATADLSEVVLEGDQQAIQRAMEERLVNGCLQPGPVWDLARRRVELEGGIRVGIFGAMIMNGEIPEDTLIIDVSDFPDDANSLEEAHKAGYRAGNQKGMLRSFSFQKLANGEWRLVLEQLSRSNSIDGTTRAWFNKNARAVPLHSTGALSEQLLVSKKRLPDGVVSLMAELDALSDEPTLYGEPLAIALKNGRPSYEDVRAVSAYRRASLDAFTEELAAYESELARLLHNRAINYQQKLWLFHNRQSEIIERILLLQQHYAADARGELAARYYARAASARDVGDADLFIQNMLSARNARDPFAGGACGGAGFNTPEDYYRAMYEQSNQDKDKWDYKLGICVVRTCNSFASKKLVMVGPCSICKTCEASFNRGIDPSRRAPAVVESSPKEQPDWYTMLLGKSALSAQRAA